MANVFERTVKILADKKDIDPSSIKLESTFSDLSFDSLDIMDLVIELEDEFDISIEVTEKLNKVSDLIKLIEESM